jgi:hypothetical protein
MYKFTGCNPDYIPNNQQGLFDVNGDQLLIDIDQTANNFTLDISDENAHDMDTHISRFVSTGLNNIMTDEELEAFFET